MAIISKVIQSKVVIVANYQVGASYGYSDAIPFGDIRDAEYGVTSKSASLYGFGDDEIKQLFYSPGGGIVRFALGGANTVTNTAANWTSITIGSTTLTRASATFVTSSSPFYWEWNTGATNPFGTTDGAAVDVDINLDVDDAAGSSAISVSNPYLTNGSASTVTVSFTSGLATNQSYRIYIQLGGEVEGPIAHLEPVGYTSDGTTSQTITLSSQYLPIDNSLVGYQIQTSGRYVPEDAPFAQWTNVVGDEVNTAFQVQRGEVATKSSSRVPPVVDIRFGQNASYTTRTVDLSRFAGMDVYIVFHHDLPNPDNSTFVYTGDLQIDNVQFDGNTYSFENSGQGWQTTTSGRSPFAMPTGTQWASLAVGTTAERWNVATGNTGSANTGNLGATAGSYYVYTETSTPVVTGDGFWLRSPLVTLSGSPGNLTFDEGRQGANIGTLRTFVHVVDTNNPDVSIYNPQERVLPNNETSFSAEILGSSGPSGTDTNTTYQIRTTSFSGPVVGSAVGQGSLTTKITVSDAPSSRTTKTYYVTAFLTSSGSSTVTSINSFDVRRGGVAPTSAVNTVSLATKYIDQGSTGGSTGAAFGYRRGDGSTLGDIGNTSSFVTSDGSLSSIWASTSFSARQIVFVTNNPAYHDELRFKVQGNPGNGLDWTRLRIADSSTTSTTTGREFKQTDAIYTYNPSLDETTWIWTNDRNENPFASALEYTAEIVKELNTGHQLTISNTSLTGTQTDSSSAVFSSAEAFAQYKIIKTSGTTPGGTANGATVASFAGGASGFTISIGTNDQPSAGQTCNYKVQLKSRYGNDSFVDSTGQNNTFSITRGSADSAPVISSVTDNNEASASVAITVNLSNNGLGGDGLFYGKGTTTNENSVTSWQASNSFRQQRNTTFYYYASRSSQASSSHTLVSGPTTKFVGYIAPDTGVTISPAAQSRSSGGTASWTLSGTTANHFYQLEDAGGNQMASGSATGTSLVLTASAASAAAWPNEGDTVVLEGLVKLETSRGGDGNFDNIPTTSVSARLTVQDTVPAPFFFSDVTSASVGQVYYTYVQITGTGGVGQTASILSGTASTAVSSSITQPSDASFTAANKTINESQYLHVKKQASSSSAIEVSVQIQVGQVSDTWNITTSAGAGDYGVIVYDDGGNKVWSSGEPTKTVRQLPAFTVVLFPPNVGSNSAIVALEGVQSQADLEANYILQSAGAGTFGIFSNAGDPFVAFESTGFIKCTWAGYCVDLFGQSRPCNTSDATSTTFFPYVIGKDIE